MNNKENKTRREAGFSPSHSSPLWSRWLETHVERTKEVWDSRELDLIKRNNEMEKRLEDRCSVAEDKVDSLAGALKEARADLEAERQAKVMMMIMMSADATSLRLEKSLL